MKNVILKETPQVSLNVPTVSDSRFRIKAGEEGALMDALTHYADSEYAVARELLMNGVEACLDAGVEPRVEVTIKDGGDGTGASVTFRDYGCGMSREFLEETFIAYGGSSKRETSERTGGFGYGSKTPFTLSNTYQVVSERDGERTLLMVCRTEDGGARAQFLDLPATGVNGTEVVIPLSVEDEVEQTMALRTENTGSIVRGEMTETSTETERKVGKMSRAVERAAWGHVAGVISLNGEVCRSRYSEVDITDAPVESAPDAVLTVTMPEVGATFVLYREASSGIRRASGPVDDFIPAVGGLAVNMGNVLYPLSNMSEEIDPADGIRRSGGRSHRLSQDNGLIYHDDVWASRRDLMTIIDCEVDSLSPAFNRDMLLDSARNKAHLTERIAQVEAALPDFLSQMLSQNATYQNALADGRLFMVLDAFYAAQSPKAVEVMEQLTYRGKPFTKGDIPEGVTVRTRVPGQGTFANPDATALDLLFNRTVAVVSEGNKCPVGRQNNLLRVLFNAFQDRNVDLNAALGVTMPALNRNRFIRRFGEAFHVVVIPEDREYEIGNVKVGGEHSDIPVLSYSKFIEVSENQATTARTAAAATSQRGSYRALVAGEWTRVTPDETAGKTVYMARHSTEYYAVLNSAFVDRDAVYVVTAPGARFEQMMSRFPGCQEMQTSNQPALAKIASLPEDERDGLLWTAYGYGALTAWDSPGIIVSLTGYGEQTARSALGDSRLTEAFDAYVERCKNLTCNYGDAVIDALKTTPASSSALYPDGRHPLCAVADGYPLLSHLRSWGRRDSMTVAVREYLALVDGKMDVEASAAASAA